MPVITLVLLAVAAVHAYTGEAQSTTARVAVLESALAKPRPAGQYTGGSKTLQLHAAKNEVESFLVVVSGGSAGLTGVTVQVAKPMVGAAVTVHAARYVNASKPSGCTGDVGLWVDPLVPAVDVYVGEKRNAFPLTIPPYENRIVWVDLFVPKSARAGSSTHLVHVNGSDFSSSLSYTLTVFDFALPTQPTLTSLFGHGADWSSLVKAHRTTTDQEAAALVKRYLKCGLMHRVSFSDFLGYGSPQMQRDAAGSTNGSFSSFVSEWGEFIDGTPLPFGPTPGRLSSVQAPHELCSLSYDKHSKRFTNCTAEAAREQVAYWANLSRRFDSKGWLSLLFDYTVDEPSCSPGDGRWDVLRRRAPMVKAANPRLRTLVTTTSTAAQEKDVVNMIDLWVPIINDLSLKRRRGSEQYCEQKAVSCTGTTPIDHDQRSHYNFVKPGNLWTYQSCMSYGCGPNSTCAQINGSGCALGWPSYAIDHHDRTGNPSGLVNRVMEWASYMYNVDGELYYAVGENFKMTDACWETANFYGGNGDGYMLYPGTPDRIGGTTGVPIESVRLKHVRDGYEDFEYLRLLEATSSRSEVLSGYVSSFMTEAFDWVDEISTFEVLRVRIGRAIEAHERRQGERKLGAGVNRKCDGCAQFKDPDCRNSNYTLFSECNCGGGGCDCLSCCAGHARKACCGVVPRSPGCDKLSHSVAS